MCKIIVFDEEKCIWYFYSAILKNYNRGVRIYARVVFLWSREGEERKQRKIYIQLLSQDNNISHIYYLIICGNN